MSKKHSGKGNPMWKNKGLGYSGIHMWLRRTFGNFGICVGCGKEGRTDWALKNGKEYLRLKSSFQRMCRGCHQRYDHKNGARPSKIGEKKNHVIRPNKTR